MLEESASNLGRVRVDGASHNQALGGMFVRPKTSPARVIRMRWRRAISRKTAWRVVVVWGLISTLKAETVLQAVAPYHVKKGKAINAKNNDTAFAYAA